MQRARLVAGTRACRCPPGADLPALRGSRPPWARCRGQLPLPSVPRALLAPPVPGTSYLGNVRNAPRWGFPCSAGGVCQEQTPACPARCLPVPGVSIPRGQQEDGVRGASPSWHRGWAAGHRVRGCRYWRCWEKSLGCRNAGSALVWDEATGPWAGAQGCGAVSGHSLWQHSWS